MPKQSIYKEVLTDIGLSDNEAIVFLTLLEIGPSSVVKISQNSKVHRTNVYNSIKRLEEKNLVFHKEENDSAVFEARNPEELMKILKRAEEEFELALPLFMINYKLSSNKTAARIFEGLKALHDILDGTLKYNDSILVYGIPKNVPDILGEDWLNNHHKKRLANKIKMLHIYNEDAKERIEYLNKMPYTEAKYLPKEFNSPVSTYICGDELILILWKNPPIIVHIHHKAIANFYRKHFQLLWEMAKK